MSELFSDLLLSRAAVANLPLLLRQTSFSHYLASGSRGEIVTGESFDPSLAQQEKSAAQRPFKVSFSAHVELLQFFLAHRREIVERIQAVLNAQRKPAEYLRAAPLLSRDFADCFFTLSGVTHEQARLKGQLDEAHWASGFKPRETTDVRNELIEPAEMMIRGFHLWQQTRWPGRNGRVRYAHTLFNLYVIRQLALLTMRIWDAGLRDAADRLSQVQGVLDALWKSSPADQPVLVRDARWLIPVAQSPTTDELAGYFEVAERISESLSEEDRIEIYKASVKTGGGHLRSQLRHVSRQKDVSLDERSLVLSTRNSNALDLGQLTQWLVPLLEAYEHAADHGNSAKRLELAGAIFQGLSADPELLLNSLDLLGPYTMIEHLFITTDRERRAVYTPMGRRHRQLVQEYEARITRLAKPLLEDCPRFRPVNGAYSPYGVLFGFTSRLLEHMALKTLTPDVDTRFSLEDVFVEGEADAERLAWVIGWRKLPHIPQEVARLYDYPQQFAEDVFDRVVHALHKRVSESDTSAARPTGRLFILPADDEQAASEASPVPDLPAHYFRSSDRQIVAANKAVFYDQAQLLRSRLEGEFVLSYETSGGWVAITKDILTEVLGKGSDVKVVGLPPLAAGVLKLMCPDLVDVQDIDSPGAACGHSTASRTGQAE